MKFLISHSISKSRQDDRTWDNRLLLWVTGLRFERLTSSMIDITALGSTTLVTMIGVVFFFAFLLLRDYLGQLLSIS